MQEDEYFRRRDQELLEQQRRRAEAQAERRLIALAIGLNDDAVVVDLQLVGYRSDTIVLLELAPPIQVAWADGGLSTRERELLLKMAAREHVAQGSPAHDQLGAWIDQRPSTDLFAASLRALSDILNSLHPEARVALRRKLIDDCTRLAGASGGFLGWNHVSNDGRRGERIAGELAWIRKLVQLVLIDPYRCSSVRHLQLLLADWALAAALVFNVAPVLEAVNWRERHRSFGRQHEPAHSTLCHVPIVADDLSSIDCFAPKNRLEQIHPSGPTLIE